MFTSSSHKRCPDQLKDADLERNYKVFAFVASGLGLAVALLYGYSVAEPPQRLAAAMTTFFAAAAPFVVGGFIGFLFGIPRTLQNNQVTPPATPPVTPKHDPRRVPGVLDDPADAVAPQTANAPHEAEMQHAWQANSNLEQISDWLTKIIVGIGLTQLTRIPAAVESTGDYIAAAISPHAPHAIGSLILVVFSVTGFVIAYLMTKSDLAREIDLQEQRRHQLVFSEHRPPD